jgi:hypothetical protein
VRPLLFLGRPTIPPPPPRAKNANHSLEICADTAALRVVVFFWWGGGQVAVAVNSTCFYPSLCYDGS